MSFNLVDSVKGLFTNELAGKMASSFGESEGSVQKALSGAIPAVLAGLLNKAGTTEGASSILNLSKEAASSGVLNNLGSFAGSGNLVSKGLEWLKKLFGDKFDNITSLISGFAGIRDSSAASVLSVAAPAALGTLGKQVNTNNLSVGGLTSLLASQKDSILSALPSGLNLAGALGLGSLGDLGSKLTGAFSSATGTARATAEKATSGGNKWLMPLIIALIVIAALYYLFKGCNKSAGDAAVPPADTVVNRAQDLPAAPVMESIKVKLPDGVELDAYRGGIEDKLVTFLNDPASQGGKDVWFDFDNLNFQTGSAEITAESMRQVNNIAAILKAYPKLKIKIGGYTDKSGDVAVNKKLSQDRADAVLKALKDTGSNSAQLVGAEGYGSEFAKAAADAPDEERRLDRRIAVGVREK
ncbi:OmpA family protein [Paraflavitalea sp. CAU 1676]|uniref:OmpA family protein n=1 Tax=Paraflavitalea sp. CAU 1676 TaxID=3032598 RepID=UPI0023DC6C7E|nr:OmpA family protein [Paraflavitalea sp. CAU 1676]MDF2187373.1 OmpA family protein [Paraflavitalea sp. CAU 1676]